jgi:2-polyprenyl-3-methyl-5-hydroxy-6-metoxy-1,4-benzoquinol methylase/glycosyltransferase involved in cell wall biosynthesis
MYAGGIPFNGETIEHESLGGSESAAYYVAKELAARGHEVNLFTENQKGGIFDGVKYVWCGERTPDQPLGRDYHFYVENTPHDVNIAQRHPAAYLKPNRAKVNLWWCHDIALKRNIAPVTGQLWQIDAIMPVSRWFKDQICETWNINPDIVEPIHNGVDYSLFEEFELKDNSVDSEEPVTLIYSSRPERGLERLVKPGGIMERLHEAGVNAELKVCGYIHDVPELSGFYHMLRSQIDLLPNCEHLGSLTKRDLYELMCTKADVWCYPTEFEEVSCITAMESMAAGLTIATTSTAALPETLGDYPNCVQFNNDENVEDKFVDWVTRFNNKFRRQPRRERTWASTTDEIEAIIVDCLSKRKTPEAVARHYLRYSDIVPLEDLITRHPDEVSSQVKEQLSLYAWKDDPVEYGKHYADGTEEMYDSDEFRYEENFDQHPRFQAVLSEITRLLQDKLVNNEDTSLKVLDYGCAHGHFTNYLAKMMPAHEFLGIDVSPKAVRIATDKAVEWDLRNVVYSEGDWLLGDIKNGAFDSYDVLILGEILEHVPDPAEFMEVCRRTVGPETLIIITTPFGPWEHASYEKEFPKRYHLHHFDRS